MVCRIFPLRDILGQTDRNYHCVTKCWETKLRVLYLLYRIQGCRIVMTFLYFFQPITIDDG